MSFWDTYKPAEGGGNVWITREEKERMIEEKTPLTVTNVNFQSGDKYGDRWVLTLAVPAVDGGELETRMIGFTVGTGVFSRDDLLEQLCKYFVETSDPQDVLLVMEKAGNGVVLRRPDGFDDGGDVPF